MPGSVLFILHDTHGFPPDLAAEIFEERGYPVTEATWAEYQALRAAQQARSRQRPFQDGGLRR